MISCTILIEEATHSLIEFFDLNQGIEIVQVEIRCLTAIGFHKNNLNISFDCV